MSIKFIHCADVHLGSPLVAASKEKQDLLNDAIQNALKNMVDLAIWKSWFCSNIAMKLREKGIKSSYLNWLSSVKFEEKIEMLHSVTVA